MQQAAFTHHVPRLGRDRDLHPLVAAALDEHVAQGPVGVDAAGVEHRVGLAKGVKAARLEIAELRIAHRDAAQRLDMNGRTGCEVQ